ncbi:MAG TPA: hypothetical protein VGG89_09550 [Candidatus Baltobacteraceae bacterium]
MTWFDRAPTWLAFIVMIAVANAVALSAMYVARRWSHRMGVTSGPPVVSAWATCAGGLTALLFAFTIVTVWNSAARAKSDVDDEAAAIRLVARDIAPAQRVLLREYVNETIAEWPALCGGEQDPKVDATLVALQQAAKPRSPSYADDLYRQLGTMEDLRNRRWQTSTSSIPDEIWVALLVLSCSVLIVLSLALTERPEPQTVLTAAVATALGTLFWVAGVLEYPFCGRTGIGPGELLDIVRAHLLS